jgi:hypothetical protein
LDLLRVSSFYDFADTIWISKPYRNFSSDVKPKAWEMRLYENKKGESRSMNSPLKVWISSGYPKMDFKRISFKSLWHLVFASPS